MPVVGFDHNRVPKQFNPNNPKGEKMF